MAPPTFSWHILLTLLAVSWLNQTVIAISIVSPLNVTYYATSCPQVHEVVRERLAVAFKEDRTVAGSVARLLFHDCFVEGCDASVLLNSTASISGEKDAFQSMTLAGFDVIDDIKAHIETVCPSTVSCADIVALASTESIFQSGGPNISMPLGRVDGRVSSKAAALAAMPNVTMNVTVLNASFAAVGLTLGDMVILSGAHTFGKAHCSNVVDRLLPVDPTLDPALAQNLTQQCNPRVNDPTITVPLDVATNATFDNQYYKNLLQGRGVLASDEVLAHDNRTVKLVQRMATNERAFFKNFSHAWVRMSMIGVKTGQEGEIRRNCGVVNRR
ncbi:peroxidase [Klebsormidium nitens]|uniref:Peroxidase n=1 Tax=Klebsormidium nitens TaxID=105231 RepID=A0A1Y1HYD6_KLENI|nr:peroxidase [Klebsormidium nitens]|eukprot:GAQ82752.1 peroxidase [Klebsormidium nitens]